MKLTDTERLILRGIQSNNAMLQELWYAACWSPMEVNGRPVIQEGDEAKRVNASIRAALTDT